MIGLDNLKREDELERGGRLMGVRNEGRDPHQAWLFKYNVFVSGGHWQDVWCSKKPAKRV